MVTNEEVHTNGYNFGNGTGTNGFKGPNGVNGSNGVHSNGVNGSGQAQDSGNLHDSVAIVSMACRWPGAANTPSKLWDMLYEGRDGWSKVPSSKISSAYFHPRRERPGSLTQEGGFFIDSDGKDFDSQFFSIPPVEAACMDPTQKLLLEAVYEAIEAAGLTREEVSGSSTGVWVGSMNIEHQYTQLRDMEYILPYSATGGTPSILSNRVNYVFNLQGPSMTVDTACSSSLYALHLAEQALKKGECDMAIVGGTNLLLGPDGYFLTDKLGVLSKSGRCHTFDSRASGYARAEGIGVVVLKRLDDALDHKDPVRAVLRATAVNANGKSGGLTLPSKTGQAKVIKSAFKSIGITPSASYFEVHGTGTPVGDPIEVSALGEAFPRGDKKMLIGGIKPNMGHAEGASGLAGIMKGVLTLEHGVIPPTINIKEFNKTIKFDEAGVEVVVAPTPLPHLPDGAQRISINSFGYGGANAHAILQDVNSVIGKYQGYRSQGAVEVDRPEAAQLFVLSADSKNSLKKNIESIAEVASKYPHEDLAYTLAARRSRFRERAYAIFKGNNWSTGAFIQGSASSSTPLGMIFTGQGAQWPQMGADLMGLRTFAKTIRHLDGVLASIGSDLEIESELLKDKATSLINKPRYSQPLCTALQVALVDQLEEFGIVPEAGTVGHSSGEIGAAYAAGFLSAEEAIVIADARGKATTGNEGHPAGGMIAVGLGADEAAKYLEGYSDSTIRIAAKNSPQSVTISGDVQAIEDVKGKLDEDKVFARLLNTNGMAYHSSHMELLGNKYQSMMEEALSKVTPGPRKQPRPWFSSVLGQQYLKSTVDPIYWRRNLEQPVLFLEALVAQTKYLGDTSCGFVELGPHAALKSPVQQILTTATESKARFTYIQCLLRGSSGQENLLQLSGNLFLRNYPVDIAKSNAAFVPDATPKVIVDLPSYSFNRVPVVDTESRFSKEWRMKRHPRHDILGTLVPGGDHAVHEWRNKLTTGEVKWLKDHKLSKDIVFPAAGFLCMAVEALTQLEEQAEAVALRDVSITTALVIPEEATVETFLHMWPAAYATSAPPNSSESWYHFAVTAWKDGNSTVHARGSISATKRSNAPKMSTCDLKQSYSAAPHYKAFTQHGLVYGPSFQRMKEIDTSLSKPTTNATMDIQPSSGLIGGESYYKFHPGVLDNCLQLTLIAAQASDLSNFTAFVPVFMQHVHLDLSASLGDNSGFAMASGTRRGQRGLYGDVSLYNSGGDFLATISGMRCVRYEGQGKEEAAEGPREPFMRSVWKPDVDTLSSEQAEVLFSGSEEEKLAGILDLLTHKAPALNILELGTDGMDFTADFLETVAPADSTRKYKQYTFANPNPDVVASAKGRFSHLKGTKFEVIDIDQLPVEFNEKFDLVISGKAVAPGALANIQKLLNTSGRVLLPGSADLKGHTLRVGNVSYIKLEAPMNVTPTNADLTLIHLETPTAFSSTLASVAEKAGFNVSQTSLLNLDSKLGGRGIVLAELEKPLLASLADEAQMAGIKTMLKQFSSLLWITNGCLAEGGDPHHSLVSGFIRSLNAEQSSPQLQSVDLSFDLSKSAEKAATFVLNLEDTLNKVEGPKESHLREKEGILYLSRLIPDEYLNRGFQEQFRTSEPTIDLVPMKDLPPVKLTFSKPGLTSTWHFTKDESIEKPLTGDEVLIKVMATGLNVKDLSVATGAFDGDFTSCECSGIIQAIGPDVKGLKVGSQVLCVQQANSGNLVRSSEKFCQEFTGSGLFNEMSTLPIVFCTAVLAIMELAKVEEGESILIESATGGAGLASIQVAKAVGANVFATVSSAEKRKYLVEEYGLPESHIFPSRDPSALSQMMEATSGKGFDVIIATSSGQYLQQTLMRAASSFGRFVDLGRVDVLSRGKLDMSQFEKNLSLFSFDLNIVFREKPKIGSRLLRKVMELYKGGQIRPLPTQVYEIAQYDEALRIFNRKSHIGKFVFSYENQDQLVKFCRNDHAFRVSFDPEGSYLLVGCTGGLGLSLSKWMASRGARHLVYMSRSGTSKLSADSLKTLSTLEQQGVKVDVVTGDVTRQEDVEQALAVCGDSLKGIVQGAMVLENVVFGDMTLKQWQDGTRAKVQGTWNLHQSTLKKPLDFFVSLSSLLGQSGAHGQTNYTAAGTFLEALAQHRHSVGLPATTIALGLIVDIGYTAQNESARTQLERIDLYGMDETDFLQVIEAAFTQKQEIPREARRFDPNTTNTIITGFEPQKLVAAANNDASWKYAPLFDRVRLAISDITESRSQGSSSSAGGQNLDAAKTHEEFIAIAEGIVKQRLVKLLYLDEDQIDCDRSISEYGLDSMIASELRNWLQRTWGLQVSFLELTGAGMSIRRIAEMVYKKRNP